MEIRQGTLKDLPVILEIYARARKFMAEHGNPDQWGTKWPPEEIVREDLETGVGYVAVEDGKILGVCHYRFGENAEENYRVIDGAWIREGAYGVVHRLAAMSSKTGAGEALVRWAVERSGGHLRIDTHRNNVPMQNLLKKLGFTYCGVIRVGDGTERHAFEI